MSSQKTVRSFRVPERVWEQARARAGREGLTVGTATAELVSAYAAGAVDVPEARRVYITADGQRVESEGTGR